MAAELVKRYTAQDGRTHVIVEVAQGGKRQRFHVTLKPVIDMNQRVTGAQYWIRHDQTCASEDAALTAALADIERLACMEQR